MVFEPQANPRIIAALAEKKVTQVGLGWVEKQTVVLRSVEHIGLVWRGGGEGHAGGTRGGVGSRLVLLREALGSDPTSDRLRPLPPLLRLLLWTAGNAAGLTQGAFGWWVGMKRKVLRKLHA